MVSDARADSVTECDVTKRRITMVKTNATPFSTILDIRYLPEVLSLWYTLIEALFWYGYCQYCFALGIGSNKLIKGCGRR
jgi:hypothetical protein